MSSTLATAAWGIILASKEGSHDVNFGQLVAGRSAAIRGVEEVLRCAIKTVVRRLQFNPDQVISDMLAAVQTDQMDVAQHENTALQKIQGEGVPNISALFHTLLNIRNLPGDQKLLADAVEDNSSTDHLGERYYRIETEGDDLALDIFISLFGQHSFSIEVLYNSRILGAEKVESLLDHYDAVLAAMVTNPSKPVSSLLDIQPSAVARNNVESSEAKLLAEAPTKIVRPVESVQSTEVVATSNVPSSSAEKKIEKLRRDVLAVGRERSKPAFKKGISLTVAQQIANPTIKQQAKFVKASTKCKK
ncbi:hypothetical protein CBOM_06310 [Ceraceosorus bombacis]|uniref:Condensation domain-containing protein n=1 Tax=Ceraceosorus bombacis TaxID=401625 RepID=A0A0P1BQW3_9BASI|nr:hypothetical protein CBOM_06310 [Ceraceosorus bombacis]